MGTRVELHVFGAGADALADARRVVEAVDDALTIHRPSPTGALNDELMAGRSVTVDNALLFDALVAVDDGYAATGGLFDPAVESGGWAGVRFDRAAARIAAGQPTALDFGGFGKGFALDRAVTVLRQAGVTSALLSAGESSIAVIGDHPLGGGWPFAIPHPLDPDATLVEIELIDEAVSISSTVNADAPGRAATIRPGDGSVVSTPRTAVAVERSGALAEMLSTALLVADTEQAARLIAGGRRHRFDFRPSDAATPPVRMFA